MYVCTNNVRTMFDYYKFVCNVLDYCKQCNYVIQEQANISNAWLDVTDFLIQISL